MSPLKKRAVLISILTVIAVLLAGLLALIAAIWLPVLDAAAVAFTVVIALFMGWFIYHSCSNFLRNRVEGIVGQVSSGNNLVRLQPKADECGPIEGLINDLLKRITDLSSQQVDNKQLVEWAKKEIQWKSQLMEKSRALEESNKTLLKRLKERDLMLRITETINSTLALDTVLGSIAKSVGTELNMEEVVILLLDHDSGSLKIAAVYGVASPQKVLNLEFKPGEGVVGEVLQTGKTIYVRDVRQEPRFMHYKGRRQVIGSFLAIPIMLHGEVAGVLGFMRNQVNAFKNEEIDFLKILSHQINFAIQNARSYETVRRQAERDPLTGLLNRRAGLERIQQDFQRSLERGQPFSVVMLDIDDFKEHNDTYGHLVGDEVLKHVAKILTENTRNVDHVCRYGGEEFLVSLYRTDLRDGAVVADKIRQAVYSHNFYPNKDQAMKVSISLGVAAIEKGCKGLTELVDQADQALLFAKARGKNRVCISTNLGIKDLKEFLSDK